MAYPDKVVGFVPDVTNHLLFIVTLLYVPAVATFASVKAIDVVPDPVASPVIDMVCFAVK